MEPGWSRGLISDRRGILKNVVTLGMRCCCLPWVGFAGGSRRALRAGSPRILCRCPVLRRQILGRCRRGHFYHPAKCYYAIRPWEIPRPECTTRSKRVQNREEKMPLFITYASYSHSGVKGLVNK